MLTINNVTVEYPDGTKAINNLSLNVKSGEKLALIGANGAGKSGVAYQSADHGAENHGIGRLYFFQDQHNGDGKGHQCAQNGNGNSIHSRFLLLIQITAGPTS